MYWRDRHHAGRMLAEWLAVLRSSLLNPIVLAVPRGGVVTAYPIALALKCPLDVIVTKKIGYPGQPELAIGAVTAAGEVLLDPRLEQDSRTGSLRCFAEEEAWRLVEECQRRERRFRGEKPAPPLRDRTVIVVDDGIATGLTTLAALRQLRRSSPQLLILATPVIPAQQVPLFQQEADHLVYLHAPSDLMSVGQYYLDFSQTEDEEVLDLLKRSPVTA